MVAITFKFQHSVGRARQISEFKDSLLYKVSSRVSQDYREKPSLKKQNKKINKQTKNKRTKWLLLHKQISRFTIIRRMVYLRECPCQGILRQLVKRGIMSVSYFQMIQEKKCKRKVNVLKLQSGNVAQDKQEKIATLLLLLLKLFQDKRLFLEKYILKQLSLRLPHRLCNI